jgi:hypothetical protein
VDVDRRNIVKKMTFGILTLATKSDYHKAIGLALSARVSNPGIPVAVACSPEVRPLLAPHFDHVVMEDPSLRGFAHKLNLDRYSPFQKTFFFDSDVLLFRPLTSVLDQWMGRPYAACGDYISDKVSPFGLDNAKVLKIIKHQRLVHIDGAGHAYFETPACHEVFDFARDVAGNYKDYAGSIRLADEDVMNITMTMLGIVPMQHFGFWSIYPSAKKGSLKMDASAGKCSMIWADTGESCCPYMMHFVANQAPLAYTIQLKRLFRRFSVRVDGVLLKAANDIYTNNILWPVSGFVRSLIKADRAKRLRDQLK